MSSKMLTQTEKRRRAGQAVWSTVASLTIMVCSQVSQAACFRVMDATLYSGKPDLKKFGISHATLAEPQRWWINAKVDVAGRHDVTVQNAKQLAGQGQAIVDPLIIDLELPLVGTDPGSDQNIQPYLDVISAMREGGYTRPLGFYGAFPRRDYWSAQKGPGTPAYRQWQAQNDRYSKVVPSVSALFPSVYTFYNDQAGWVRYAQANVAEAKRMGQGRPVYPFIWPQYHDSAGALAYQYLPRDYWLQELRTIAQIADGVVIWGGWDTPNRRAEAWDDNAQWWQATLAFIKSQPNVCPAQ